MIIFTNEQINNEDFYILKNKLKEEERNNNGII